MNLTVLLITSSTSFTIMGISALLYKRVQKYQADHLNRLSFGIFLQAMLPFSFIPQGLFEGEKYAMSLTIFAIVGADLFMVGLLLHVWNLKIHQQVTVPTRYLGLVMMVGFVMAAIITGTKVMWMDQSG